MMTDIPHRDGCNASHITTFVGTRGDLIARCTECTRWCVTKDAGTNEQLDTVDQPAADSQWRCGSHLDRNVDWRGQGCPKCSAHKERRIREREARRQARREALAEQAARRR